MSSEAGPAGPLLSAENLGKCYQIYDRPQDRLKQTLWRGRRHFYREFWALRGVSFAVQRGEALGIVGVNGAGKSTLLQILAGVLEPSEGRAVVNGREAAILELGSGFDLEFTGRENVFFQGAILGATPREIEQRFDEIAAFADIGSFINQPVKTYSTGMLIRLAFAVNVLLEPDVLIVDEALAVGDVKFQFKCMSHMRKLLDRGVGIALVTHDVQTVRSFCQRAIWLHEGCVSAVGDTSSVTARYMRFLFGSSETESAGAPAAIPGAPAATAAGPADIVPDFAPPPARLPKAVSRRSLVTLDQRADLIRWGSGEILVEGVALDNGTIGCAPAFEHGERLHLEVQFRALHDVDSRDIGLGFSFRNTKGLDILTYTTWDAGQRLGPLKAGQMVRLAFELENILAPADYALVIHVEDVPMPTKRHYFDFVENAIVLRVTGIRLIFSSVLHHVEPVPVGPPEPMRGNTHVVVDG